MKTNSRMIVLLMTMVSADVVYGQNNLLPNGNFNSPNDMNGWIAQGMGYIEYSNLDADGLGGGSMLLAAFDSSNSEIAKSSCFAVPSTPGAQFVFGGQYQLIQEIGAAGGADLQCYSYTDNSCTSGQFDLGKTTEPNAPVDVSFYGSFHYWNPVHGVLGTVKSLNCAVIASGAFDGLGSDRPAPVRVDDLFFYSAVSNYPITLLGGSLSGSWYDPSTSGEGFQLEFTAQANTLLATWYTYSPDGSGTTQWVYGQGSYSPEKNSVTIPAVLTSGASFAPHFVSADVKKTPWGNLTFTFIDCDHATMSWSSTLPGYGSGTQQLQRLTSIAGLNCPQ